MADERGTDHDAVVHRVAAGLSDHFGPDADVAHRPNHAGADRLNFEVRTPHGHLWVKVARHADDAAALRRWASCAGLLAGRHRAPAVRAVIEVEGRAALVFDRLEGRVCTADDLAGLLPELLATTAALHADTELAGLLGAAVPAATTFRAVWLDRFHEELAAFRGQVDEDLRRWLADEVTGLEVRLASPAFDVPVCSPVHADLWRENVLIGGGGWWLLDWEDLSVGDPVADDSVLLHEALGPRSEAWHDARRPADPHEAERFEVAAVANLLDDVIDPLADSLETGDPGVARWKREQHERAVATYRARDETGTGR